MMKIKIILLFLAAGVFLNAQTFKRTGTSGFTFLEIPANARTAALGEASISLADLNSDAVFNNPAALGFINQTHSLSVSYAPWIADIKHYASSYAFNSPIGVFGLGAVLMDFGSFTKTAVPTSGGLYEVLGTFKANALALGLTYSRRLTDRFSFGVTLKYVKESIDIYDAHNILFDGGVIYYTGLSSLRIAAALQNFGVDAKYLNDQFRMPSILKLGAAAEVLGNFDSEYRVTVIAEALHPNDSDERLNLGTEVSWKNIITFRGGYKFFYDEESYSVGVGLNPQLNVPMNFDFAFSDYGRLGNILRFTFQFGLL